MSLRIWTRAASRPSARLTPESEMAGLDAGIAAFEESFMRLRASFQSLRSIRSYGKLWLAVQRRLAALVLGFLALAGMANIAGAGERTVKIVAFGDSLSVGYQLPAQDAFPVQLEKALKAKGAAVEIANA